MAKSRRPNKKMPRSAESPLEVEFEKNRAAREAKERDRELRRQLERCRDFVPGKGGVWGSDSYEKPWHWEREGKLDPLDPAWSAANAEFSREWVSLWLDAAKAVNDAGKAEWIEELDPRRAELSAKFQDWPALLSEMHALFRKVITTGSQASQQVARKLAELRRRLEPSESARKRGNVIVGGRWNAALYFDWLLEELAVLVGRKVRPARAVDAGAQARQRQGSNLGGGGTPRAASGRSRARGRPKAPEGWIYVVQAAEQYEVARSTLQSWLDKDLSNGSLKPEDVVMDKDLHQKRVRVDALQKILGRRGRASG